MALTRVQRAERAVLNAQLDLMLLEWQLKAAKRAERGRAVMPVGGKVIGGMRRPAQKGREAGPARVTTTPLVPKATTAKNAPLVRAAGGKGSTKAAR